MNEGRTRDLERPAFVVWVALLLAPVVAQGLWRPLVHFLGSRGDAGTVTGAALAVGGLLALVEAARPGRTPLRSLALGALAAVGSAAGLSLGPAGLLTLLGVAVATVSLVRWLSPRLPRAFDGLVGCHRGVAGLYLAAALVATLSTARMSVFMGDPARVDQQVLPGETFLETHSCLTAYVRADTLARQGVDNLYDERFWLRSGEPPPGTADAGDPYSPFHLDYYAYPPPFLLAVAPLLPLEGDFPAQRALWFGLNGLLLAAGLWIVARSVEGPHAHRALLLAPIFYGSAPILATLQVGNFQIAAVVLSVLAMVAFQRDRPAWGGALLAFAILSKISPGVLGIVLLAQRRWRSAAFTAGFGVLFLALAAITRGTDPLVSFLTYAFPRIRSGEAFAFLDDVRFNILTNSGPFGLPFKLQLLGLDVGDPWVLARRLSGVYTGGLAVLAVLAGRRSQGRPADALIWMPLLVLAALQSPFAPGYTVVGLLWALTLLAVEVRGWRGGIALAALGLLLTVVLPWTACTVLQSAAAIGVCIWLILRVSRS